ncbi:uncharacterized protein LOC111385218 [Olea europaea var. sylvestris]|uniref:uncharacterized protein LOC111385218 n=1 Tax=Olea europaea var. sylvestris TaxID=158386 RepID=UPI000C1CD567|nr:uncharacterized protein LOC111385218 [Olea europaea var. sylvestris]
MEIRDIKELEWPRPMATPPGKRNQGRYCHFHKDHGHDTKECQQLKDEIKRLFRRGLLGKNVKDNRGKQKVEDYLPPRAGVINVIAEGIAGGGDSNSARKRYAQSLGICSIQRKVRFSQNITFDEEDLVGVAHHHDDDSVIVGYIADFDVKIGFGRATVIPEGTVELPVTLGIYPTAMVIVVSFLVVKTLMAYNAIYGRPLLNVTGAILSTYQQVMKFPTSRGIGCLRGDQEASKKCYVDNILVKGIQYTSEGNTIDYDVGGRTSEGEDRTT